MRRVADVGILATGHDVADARIHKIVDSLARRGLSVELHGLGVAESGPVGATVTASPRPGFMGRAMRALVLPWRTRAKVLFTVDPDAVPPARLAAALRRQKVVVDLHEDYAKLLQDRPGLGGLARTLAVATVKAATTLASGAALTVVADDHVPPLTARRRIVVRNEPVQRLLASPSDLDREPRAVYVGDLRASRGLFDMVDAIAAAPGWSLDLIGPVSPADQQRLTERLAAADLAGRVRLHGRRPPREAWEIVAGAWVGFALLHDTPAFRDAVPTKLNEYVASGLAVIVSDLPRQAEAVDQAGAGTVVRNSAEAAGVLMDWMADREQLARYHAAARAWSRSFAPENGYDRLADEVAALVVSS